MKIHKSITLDKLMASINRRQTTLDNPGFCTICGHQQDGCEPDARGYECDSCGSHAVCGDEELLMMIL